MSDHDRDAPGSGEKQGRHTAGAFDIRNFIGALLGLYGVILTFMGIFGDKHYEKTGNIDANLYAGLVLLVISAFFFGWARLKPIIVPEHVEPADDDPSRPAPKRKPKGH